MKINHLKDGVFYAQMELESNIFGNRVIDARPSDAIAVALRLNSPILVAPRVLAEAGVKEDTLRNVKKPRNKPDLSLKALKKKLKKAVEEEEYEFAAKLRDKISNLES